MADVKPSTWAGRLKARWKNHLGTVVLVLAVFFGVQAWQTRDFNATIDLATPVQWLGPDGASQNGTLQDAIHAVRPGDGVMALYIWAEWCAICTAQQGTINRLTQDWPVLTVAMQSGDAHQVRRYQLQRDLPWTTVIDSRSQIARAQGFRSVPAFVVLDSQNRLRFPTVGYTPGWGMRTRLWAASLL
jgi:hypothetical protein